MSRFNLIDEKWIPVRFLDGTRDELGIHDTLHRSKEISFIEDSSPLVVASLHRFLLALLYRALEGPTDIDQAKALFSSGLPDEQVADYLERWRGRFWLFDEEYPFFQIPDYEPKEKGGKKLWRSWAAIAAEHNADHAMVLFDHLDVRRAGSIAANKAIRWLIACQTFALGGGRSDFKYTKSGPSATSVMAFPLGRNLQDTLLFSLVPENREIAKTDTPVWERKPESLETLKKGMERPVLGWADLYTWRTRSVKFNPQGNDYSISELTFASGIECSLEGYVDPMLGYWIDEKKGKLPVQFRDRGLWRDFDSLLPDESRLAPLVIEHTTILARKDRRRFPKSVIVLGQANNKAKIKYWRMERFALPEALGTDRFIRTEIHQLLSDAEEAQNALWLACRTFARQLLSRGGPEPAAKDVRNFVDQMSANGWYWSVMESHFHEILRDYGLDRDADDIRRKWLESVRNALRGAWEQHSASVATGDAWAIRALVKAEKPVWEKLKELSNEIMKLEPNKEVA